MIKIESLGKLLPAGENMSCFHPAFAPLSDDGLIFTFQTYNSSDCYSEPLAEIYENGCWRDSMRIPGMENVPLGNGFIQGVADIRPFAGKDGSVAVFGCSTVYCKSECAVEKDNFEQFSVYNIYRPGQGWGVPGRLPGVRVACAQLEQNDNGNWIVPTYFEYGVADDITGVDKLPRYAVQTLEIQLQNDSLSVSDKGNILELPVKRGFIEPSVVRYQDRYYMTLRAEDGHAYWTSSNDGLNWQTPQPWKFDDGSPMTTDSTQQHFLELNNKLYLLYTRKDPCNGDVFRYRAPLFMAQVDMGKGTIEKSSEIVVFEKREQHGVIGLLGNFHAVKLPDGSGIVSDARLYINYDDNGNESGCVSELVAVRLCVCD